MSRRSSKIVRLFVLSLHYFKWSDVLRQMAIFFLTSQAGEESTLPSALFLLLSYSLELHQFSSCTQLAGSVALMCLLKDDG